MSITGILSSVLFGSDAASNAQSAQNKFHKIQQEFQQVGKDLQSGNLSAARADFATLQRDVPQGATSTRSTQGAANSAAATAGSSAIAQEFKQLSQDLQSGNLPAAQADYATLQQDFQGQAAQSQGRHHHASGDSGGSSGNGSGSDFGQSQISQLFAQLGQSLQAGNATAAQQAYSTLQNDLTQFAGTNGLRAALPGSTLSSSGSVSVSA